MNNEDGTREIVIEAGDRAPSTEGGKTDNLWSFGARQPWIVRDPTLGLRTPSPLEAAVNNETPDQTGYHKKDTPNGSSAVPLRQFKFGRRRFQALYQWEGVVETVNGSCFRARLTPYGRNGNGDGDGASVEYADFEYEDLADEEEIDRVERGAVFYWTIGRMRDSAGTVTNSSLLRFRRVPGPTPYQKRRAQEAANALLADLDGD